MFFFLIKQFLLIIYPFAQLFIIIFEIYQFIGRKKIKKKI